MNQLEIHYPDAAGFKSGDTALAAAREIESGGRARFLRENVLAWFKLSPRKATADEVARALGEHVLSIRPRVTELKRKGLLVDTGERRASSMGKKQAVMAATQGHQC